MSARKKGQSLFPANFPEVLVLVGSPNESGKSTALAGAVMNALENLHIEPTYYHIAKYPVAACYNCGACQITGDCRIVNDPWHVLARHMETCDLMFLVAPVYFAGPTAHLKAALDRCQMFWARKYVLKQEMPPKRPCHLLVVGDGGDPFGSEPMETVCTSALNCANLRVSGHVHRFIGKDYDVARVPGIVGTALGELEPPQREPGDSGEERSGKEQPQ